MATRLTASTGVIDKLDVKKIRIFRDESMKWSGRLKHSSIYLLKSASIARLTRFQSGNKAILGNDPLVIGTDSQSWSYNVLEGDKIYVGMATQDQNLSSIESNRNHVSIFLNVTVGDKIVFTLELTELKIEHLGIIRTIDMNTHTGKTMYPWLSGITGSIGFSIRIDKYRFVDFTMDETNAIISTLATQEIAIPLKTQTDYEAVGLGTADFVVTDITTDPGNNFSLTSRLGGTGISVLDADGSVVITSSLKANTITHPVGGPLVFRGATGAANSVTLDINGNIVVDSGKIVTGTVKALSGTSTELTNNAGLGVHVSNTGVISFDTAPLFNRIESNPGSHLDLIEGTNQLGIRVESSTGNVNITGSSLETNNIDAETGALNIGASTQTKINMCATSNITSVKSNLTAVKGIDVIGNLTISGTINGLDMASNVGSVTIHSDVTDAGSGAIITVSERNQIGTNNTSNVGSVTAHSDVTNAGSGKIITVAERAQIAINNTEATGSVTIHSDVTNAGSGAIITTAERAQISTNTTNISSGMSNHSDVNISSPVDLNLLAYSTGNTRFENKTIAALGLSGSVHTHTASDISDFSTAVDARLTVNKGAINGVATLDGNSVVPNSQIELDLLDYKGVWNASTNSPTLVSSVGDTGSVYVVNVPGNTSLNGNNDWQNTDWVIFDGKVWNKIDNSDLVSSVAGRTGAITLSTADISDITDVGSGAIITAAERAQIATNTANITGSVTSHSDITSAGSGAIITADERAQIITNTNNLAGSATIHSDITDVGSGAIITSVEREIIQTGETGTCTKHTDIASAGSGAIITVAERAQIAVNASNATGVVTIHSDVSSAGSGKIITVAERAQIVANHNNNIGSVTSRNDITSAGSGIIISTEERSAISTTTGNLAGLINLNGGTMSGNLLMDGNNITAMNETVKGTITLGNVESVGDELKEKITFTSTTSSIQWIAPANTSSIRVKLWGGGGAGSDYAETPPWGSGGAGGYTYIEYPAVEGDEFWVTVGEKGIHASAGGQGGEVGLHGQGGSYTGQASNYDSGGGGSYSAIHKLVGGNYTLIACAGGGGGSGAEQTVPGTGGGGNGGNGMNGGNGAAGNGGAAGTGGARGGAFGENGENYGALTQTSLDAFGGKGGSIADGGAGGGGYGGGGAGFQSGGGGGGGGYTDPAGSNPVITTPSNEIAVNTGDEDYTPSTSGGGTGNANGQNGSIVIAVYSVASSDNLRRLKSASGKNLALENFSGNSSVTLTSSANIDVKNVVSLLDATDTTSSINGSLVTAGGIGITKNMTVGTVLRLDHQASSPSAPLTNNVRLYVKSGVLYFKNGTDVERTVSLT